MASLHCMGFIKRRWIYRGGCRKIGFDILVFGNSFIEVEEDVADDGPGGEFADVRVKGRFGSANVDELVGGDAVGFEVAQFVEVGLAQLA